ncbi:cellulose synthase subunit BcsC [Aeoliella mucimassa]|uniref:Cellulose synthase subunit BcsC n=2 Tax=Aeoliella mucimassa TaxID=2527972 RepID=A0A518AIU8_9BACT|nr:cellulose synthase subunit BcsC [Aeoliella mucimassa]
MDADPRKPPPKAGGLPLVPRPVRGHEVYPKSMRRIALSTPLLLMVAALSGCNNLNSQALNSEGVRLYQQGNYQQASIRFQEAIANDPTSANGYYNLAASLHKSGTMYNRPNDLQQAETLYNKCLEHDPNHAECYRGLAVLLSETNRQDASFRLLSGWVQANPSLPDARIELARLYEETGRAEEAKTTLIDALNVDPNNARALTALGRLRDQSGDYAQALVNYSRSLEINRFQPEVAARVASLNAATGNTTATSTGTSATQLGSNNMWQPTVRY